MTYDLAHVSRHVDGWWRCLAVTGVVVGWLAGGVCGSRALLVVAVVHLLLLSAPLLRQFL